MSDLQAIADRFEIEALRGEFTDAGMMRDYDRFASLFTHDGTWRMPHANVEFVGREEIRAGIERLRGLWDYAVQTVHPGTIQLAGDTAVGRAYVAELGRMRDGTSHVNYSLYPRALPAHLGRLEVHGAGLRGHLPRHHCAGGLGAPRSEGRPAPTTEVHMPQTTATVGVRYMIDDVADAIAFYTTQLGFTLEQDASPAFAAVSRDGVRLLLSGPTSSGRRAMPDGTRPVPGGWNRLQLQVADLAAEVERLRAAGCRFRNDIVTGPGGSQILLEDPSGNLVELFQPAR